MGRFIQWRRRIWFRWKSWKKIGKLRSYQRDFTILTGYRQEKQEDYSSKLKNERTLTGKWDVRFLVKFLSFPPVWENHFLKRKKKSWSSFMMNKDRSEIRHRRNIGGGFKKLSYGGAKSNLLKKWGKAEDRRPLTKDLIG